MTEQSLEAWLWWGALVLAASLAGTGLARLMPWSRSARGAAVPTAFGLALAPFLAGLATVLALGLLRGQSHAMHVGVVLALLAVGGAACRLPRAAPAGEAPPRLGGILVMGLAGLVLGWLMYVAVESLLLPLVANDSLEYATVGRHLFEKGDLLAYPAVDPSQGSSGFFAPWTHPPLYTALIYLAYAAQHHADMPGLMRVIAPWFLLTAGLLVQCLGNAAGRVTGLLALVLVVSAPLAAVGASTALIDALTMCGLALLLAAVAHLQGPPVRVALVRGAVLGVGMWAHSQAVLFVPLAIGACIVLDGWGRPRELARSLALMLVAAAVVAAWPYGRNLALFGSLISDNPAVFAMPELNWVEYFEKARSLTTWPEKIQYGILKGWFVLDAYGFVFWFMLPGIWLWLRTRPRVAWTAALRHGSWGDVDRLFAAAGAIILVYLGGVLVSTLAGIDLMIRNDRYLLVLLPCAALFGGLALARMLSAGRWLESEGGWRGNGLALGVIALTALLVVQLLGAHGYQQIRRTTFDIPLGSLFSDSHLQKLRLWPGFAAVRYATANTPADSVVLSERPAEMYYAQRRMMSFLDPRLVPVYREPDPGWAGAQLHALGVTHLQMPGYSHPAIYNTAVQGILASPALSTLLFAEGMEQIYALGSSGKVVGEARDIGPAARSWVMVKRFAPLNILVHQRPGPLRPGTTSEGGFEIPVLQRSWSTMLLIGGTPATGLRQQGDDLVNVTAGGEYLLTLDLEGDAYAYAYVFQYDDRGFSVGGTRPSSELIGELPLSEGKGVRTLTRRVLLRPDTQNIRIGVEHRGNTRVRLLGVRIAPVQAPTLAPLPLPSEDRASGP